MNNLVDVKKMSNEDIMKAIGQDDGSTTPSLPRLMINRNPEDEEGNRLPIGRFSVYHTEAGENVYGLPVKFRPFISAMQYMEYSAEEQAYLSRSIIFKNWKDEPIDTIGGVRCGKVPFKDRVNLTSDELADQRSKKCYRLVYGLVSFIGKIANDTDFEVKDYPVLWRVTGTQFNPVGNALKSISQRKKLMFNCILNLETEKRKSGANVFYIAKIGVNADAGVKLTKTDEDTLRNFQEVIENENTEVFELYKQAKKGKATSNDAANAKVINEVTIDPVKELSS
jgi:hypothetical protein